MENTAEAMQGVPVEILQRWISHCYRADPEYRKGIAARMRLSASESYIVKIRVRRRVSFGGYRE
jgi:hypothetical protein